MPGKKQYAELESRLKEALVNTFKDLRVQIAEDLHYKGANIVVTSSDFRHMLPEQRFHHLVRALPEDLYEDLRGGFVWFELAPGQDPREYMKMPRSEDIASKEADIHKRLKDIKFFKKFESHHLSKKRAPDRLDLTVAREILSGAGLGTEEVTHACLFLIRHGGHSDAQVLTSVMEELAGEGSDQAPGKHSKSRA